MDTPETVNLLGGALCLDFANSVDWSADGRPVKDDVLTDTDHLRRWGRRLGIDAPDPSPDELDRALQTRLALHAAFSAVATNASPPQDSLDRIAAAHAEAAVTGHLAPAAAGGWRLDWPSGDPRRVRFAVVADAVALLADPNLLARVRHCPGRDCGWLFLDRSGRRRWCSMSTCGSRAKMRRLYERRRPA